MRSRRAELDAPGPDPSSLADLGAGFLAHQIGEPPRQLALVGLRKGAIEHVGDRPGRARGRREIRAADSWRPRFCGLPTSAEMCVSAPLQQRLVGESCSRSALRARRGLRPSAAHLTIVNSRFQRTVERPAPELPGRVRLRQTEKKMICALPTMFSNGT